MEESNFQDLQVNQFFRLPYLQTSFVDENKPEETRLISETAGLFSAEYVAKSIVKDVLKGNFMNTIGMDGFILGKFIKQSCLLR